MTINKLTNNTKLSKPALTGITFTSAFIITLMIYAFTLAPTVTGEDSGELISAAYGFGVAHPPGYPLWTMLAGIAIRVFPFENIAFRVNLLSAVLASFSAAVLCITLNRFFDIKRLTALFGSLCFGCGLHLWSQAVITEVYTLHILLVCLIVYFALLWRQNQSNRQLYIIALLTGLALANHHLAVLVPPFLLAVVLICKPGVFLKPKTVFGCLFFLSAGLLPYLYLILAAKNDPYMNWGNPDSWQSLLDHVLRRQYSDESMQVPHTLKRIMKHWQYLWQWNVQQYTAWAVPFMGIGIVYLAVKKRMLLFLTALFFLLHSVLLSELLNFSFHRQELFCVRVFLLPCYIITAVWLTLGCNVTGRWITSRIKDRLLCGLIGAIPAAAAAVIVIAGNYDPNNMSNYYYADDHANNILNSLEENAIIIPSGDDNTFPLIYKHNVEKNRPDIIIADKYGYIEYKLYHSMPDAPRKIKTHQQRDQIEAYLIKHSGRPVYYTVKPGLNLLPDYQTIRTGMLHKVCLKSQTASKTADFKYSYRNFDNEDTVLDYAASVIISDYYFYLANEAFGQNKISKAFEYIQKTAELSQGIKEEMNNIGTLLAEFQQPDEAVYYFEQAAKIDRKYLTPRWNLARLFKAKGDMLHAIQVFNDIASLDPEDYRVFGELGFLLYQHGNPDLAVINWGKSLAINPDQPQIIQAVAEMNQHAIKIPTATSTDNTTETLPQTSTPAP